MSQLDKFFIDREPTTPATPAPPPIQEGTGLSKYFLPQAEQQEQPQQVGRGTYIPDQRRIALPFSQADPELQLSDVDRAISQPQGDPYDTHINYLWSSTGNKEQVAGKSHDRLRKGKGKSAILT